jgi:gliding motility-associated-like protein
MRCFLLLFFILQGQVGLSQLESTHWYFRTAAMEFMDEEPIANLTNSALQQRTAASISDSLGNLLFYQIGSKIYNRIHDVMPNEDDWMFISENGSIIIPNPGNPMQYYLFGASTFFPTLGVDSGTGYSLIDMTLDGGLGDAVPGQRMVQLADSMAGGICATPHANGRDFWVVTYRCSTPDFYCFLVNDTGVVTEPVISPAASFASANSCSGTLRFSHDGSMLAASYIGSTRLYQFDNSTGIVSNELVIGPTEVSVGLEFSSDDTKLYGGWPRQWDVSVYDEATIQASMVDLAQPPTALYGLQMGMDGKIYGNNYDPVASASYYVGAINNPNASGVNCNYEDSVVYLLGRDGGLSMPKFLSSFFVTQFEVEGRCAGDTTFFDINFHFIDSVLWNFGDPGSGAANTSTLVDAWHIYDEPGSYTVTLIAQNGAKTDTVTRNITIKAPPEIDLGPDSEFCASIGSSTTLSLGGKKGDYLWSDGSTDSTLTVSQSGVYALTFTDECGTDEDSVEVFASAPLSVSLPPDTSLCADSFEILPVVSNNHRLTKYTWNSGDTTLSFTTTRDITGEHTKLLTFTAGNTCGKDSATIAVTFLAQPDGFLPNDSIYCLDDPFFLLNQQSPGIRYQWSNGNTGPQLRISESGTYWLQSTSVCDTLIDTFNITFNGEPKVDIGNDTFICPEVEVRFFNRIPSNQLPGTQSYLWSTGSTDSALITALDSSQILTVSATYDQCTVRDSIRVILQNDCPERCVPSIANIITPNGDGINDQLKINMTCKALDLSFSIYNRWGQLLYQSQSQRPSWDGSVNGEFASDGTYFYVLTYMDEAGQERRFQGSLTVVR